VSETPNGLPLLVDPEQDLYQLEAQLDLFEKGRKLRKFSLDPDWEIVVQILQDYRDKARDTLIALPPGAPHVLQSHAAASASNDMFTFFQQDIDNAIEIANNPPPELKNHIRGIRKAVEEAQGG
jgi:hypothetical protein